MVKIKFISGFGLFSYHDVPQTWVDGDVREVSDERAKYLCESFPKNFSVVIEQKAFTAPPENKAALKPGKHK